MAKKRKPVTRTDAKRAMVKTRTDGWISALTALGTVKDKRQYTRFVSHGTDFAENLDLWRSDDLAGRIVETIPNEMMRQGWELCVDGPKGKKIQEQVKALLEDLNFDQKLWQSLCQERAFGGSGILMGGNDLKDLAQPLDMKKLVSLNFLESFEPQELPANRWQNDPSKRGFGQPMTYYLQPMSKGGSSVSGIVVHESRLLIFPGIQVSRRQITSQSGWGDSSLSRCRETLRDFQTSWAAAGLLVAEFAQAVWKIKGLAEIISLDRDREISARIQAMELASSTVRAKVLDSEEEWERKQTPVSGLPELLDRFATRLAAAADIPVTLLMGMSPAGLNATGESDIRTFYDRVKAMQNRKLRPAIEKAVKVAFKALGYEEPEDWYIKFNPLWQPTDQEVAQTRLTQMQTDTGYIDAQVATPEEVREQRFGGRDYSLETRLDPSKKIEPVVDDEYAAMAEQAKKPQERIVNPKVGEEVVEVEEN